MVKPMDNVYDEGRIYKKGEHMENKVKRADGMMKRPMTLLPPLEKRTRSGERVIGYKAARRRPRKSNAFLQMLEGRAPVFSATPNRGGWKMQKKQGKFN
jgi:hypothetical protein